MTKTEMRKLMKELVRQSADQRRGAWLDIPGTGFAVRGFYVAHRFGESLHFALRGPNGRESSGGQVKYYLDRTASDLVDGTIQTHWVAGGDDR